MMDYHSSQKPWYEKFWNSIYYPVYRLFYTIRTTIGPRAIKHYYQRARYGYSYQDCWSIDWHLADIIPKMIRELKENTHGIPGEIVSHWDPDENGNLTDENWVMAENEWEMILDKIARAFELEYELKDHRLFDCVDEEHENTMKELMADREHFKECRIMTQEERDAIEDGWKLFREYFGNLWD